MESKLLQTKDIGDVSSVTVCYFGSCTLGERPWARAFPAEIAMAISVSPGTHPEPLQTHLIPKSW
jgi:putative IMPACT (imprinted ancient) family translation regulator